MRYETAASAVRVALITGTVFLGLSPRTEASAPGPVATLHVFPPAVHLSNARDRQSLVVQAVEPNGITRDVTLQASIAVDNPAKARLNGRTLRPLADGDTALTITFADQKCSVPVHVEHAGQNPDLSFRLDVMPVFMRSGCNAGSCHGSARGKDGFRLSLFGFDAEADYQRLTRELPGRRINLALPAESLLLTKATAAVPHTGGAKLKPDDPYYATLARWLEAGAKNDPGPTPAVVAVELSPREAVLDGPDATQQFTVLAKYADGTDRDVTALAVFLSNNDSAAKIGPSGLVTAGSRGEAFVMARFETHTVGSQVITLPKELAFEWVAPPVANPIDELVNAKLLKLRINPSGPCSDEEFLRRASLDICGVLPTSDEYRSFMASPDPAKRANLVDQLLERKEFVDQWVMKWSELMMIRTVQNQVSYKAMLLYSGWLQDRIEANTPLDALVRELLAAKGGTFTNPATNYFQHERDTLKTAENVAQVFMGMRIQCAQCHNHPFDRWTMDDYYGFANFFAQIGRKPGEDPRETIVFNSGGGDVKHPVGGRVVPPKFLGGAAPDFTSPDNAGKDRREVLAAWLASPDNPHFGRNLANIVWTHFFGRGIVDEVDDVRVSNPPVNEALLTALANGLVASKYDFKQLVRQICTSHTYQRSTRPNETNAGDEQNFSKAKLRRIRAEVLLDIMTAATGTQNKFKGLPLGARAVQIADGNTSTYFLTTFGRATRATACSCEVKMEPNLSQALHLLNGDTTQQKIRQGGVVKQLLDKKMTPEQVIEELYLRTLTRRPTEKEMRGLLDIIEGDASAKTPAGILETLEDGFWAILNSREFVFNH
ncbi:MAG: DUF1549 domain-containing protein [Pirellulales bacterium]